MGGVGLKSGVTISFAERFARSDQFDSIFREGMSLVEETAAYLDGAGRRDAKALNPALAVSYATESMRLTTRLLELASWLLVRRSIKSGELTPDEAQAKRRRIRLTTIGRPSHVTGFAELPEGLRLLIERSFSLNDRIVLLDRALEAPPVAVVAPPVENAVIEQMDHLKKAFGARH